MAALAPFAVGTRVSTTINGEAVSGIVQRLLGRAMTIQLDAPYQTTTTTGSRVDALYSVTRYPENVTATTNEEPTGMTTTTTAFTIGQQVDYTSRLNENTGIVTAVTPDGSRFLVDWGRVDGRQVTVWESASHLIATTPDPAPVAAPASPACPVVTAIASTLPALDPAPRLLAESDAMERSAMITALPAALTALNTTRPEDREAVIEAAAYGLTDAEYAYYDALMAVDAYLTANPDALNAQRIACGQLCLCLDGPAPDDLDALLQQDAYPVTADTLSAILESDDPRAAWTAHMATTEPVPFVNEDDALIAPWIAAGGLGVSSLTGMHGWSPVTDVDPLRTEQPQLQHTTQDTDDCATLIETVSTYGQQAYVTKAVRTMMGDDTGTVCLKSAPSLDAGRKIWVVTHSRFGQTYSSAFRSRSHAERWHEQLTPRTEQERLQHTTPPASDDTPDDDDYASQGVLPGCECGCSGDYLYPGLTETPDTDAALVDHDQEARWLQSDARPDVCEGCEYEVTECHCPTDDPDPRRLRVLVACEFSGVVRRAFRARGHDAWSCDLLPAEDDSPHHITGDVRDHLDDGWDLMIAHPPCTHLAVSGARWFRDKQDEQADALAFVRNLLDAPIPRIALENPVSVISSRIRKPDQIIQPWQFGHGETKATCLWLKGLPALTPTDVVDGREARVHRMPPGPDRWKERSRTFEGIAAAMAAQWSPDLSLAPDPLGPILDDLTASFRDPACWSTGTHTTTPTPARESPWDHATNVPGTNRRAALWSCLYGPQDAKEDNYPAYEDITQSGDDYLAYYTSTPNPRPYHEWLHEARPDWQERMDRDADDDTPYDRCDVFGHPGSADQPLAFTDDNRMLCVCHLPDDDTPPDGPDWEDPVTVTEATLRELDRKQHMQATARYDPAYIASLNRRTPSHWADVTTEEPAWLGALICPPEHMGLEFDR